MQLVYCAVLQWRDKYLKFIFYYLNFVLFSNIRNWISNIRKWISNIKNEFQILENEFQIFENRWYFLISEKLAAFQGMQVSPAKHSYSWLPRKCDYRTDTRIDRRTYRQTLDKGSLCVAMLRRQHKNEFQRFEIHFLIFKIHFEIFENHVLILEISTIFRY